MFKKIIFYFLLAYAIIGFLLLPFVIESQLIDIVKKETNSKITIGNTYLNPFLFKLKLDDIKLVDDKDVHLLSLKSLSFDLELYSLFKSAIHIKDFILEKPSIFLVYEKDKTINLASILKQTAKKEQSDAPSDTKLPRIIVDRVLIIDGNIEYEDFTHESKFDFSFDNIGLELKDIDTADMKTDDATFRFYTNLGDGGFFDLKSQLLSLEPFEVKGSVKFEAGKLYTQYKYVKDILNLEVANGKIHFNSQYHFNMDDINATTINNINLSVSKLRIKPKDKHKDVLNLEYFAVNNATLKPMQETLHVEKIVLDSLHVKAKRDDGLKIDWLDYIKVNGLNQDEQNTSTQTQTSKPWNVRIDEIALEKIKVNFSDAGVSPSVDTNLDEMNIYLQDITLEGVKPSFYQLDLRVNEKFTCSSSGEFKHKILDLNSYTKCNDLDIVRFRPYIDDIAKKSLSVYNLKLMRATLGFDANVSVLELDEEIGISVNDANINLNNFALNKKSTNERLVNFVDFNVSGIDVNTTAKTVNITKTELNGLKINTRLYANGKLNMDKLVVAKKAKKQKKKVKKEKDYRVKLKHFALNSAKVLFEDKTLKPKLQTKIDRLNFNVYNIDSKEKTWLDYKLSLRLNSKGYVKANGKIRHTPLKQTGKLDLKKLSLKEFSPYIQRDAYLKLNDGYLSLKTKIDYAQSKKKADLKVSGNIDVNEFFLFDSRDNSTLLSFNKLSLNSFDYEMSPDRAFVNELDIKGFYVNAIIDENKSINFSSLVKEKTDADVESSDNNTTKFPFKIMKVNIESGSAGFADLSLPLKFKTDIHHLNGVIYSISSEANEVSYVDIVGEIDKYGSTKLIGSVDSSNPKSYTDLEFNFRNLELNSLSGYSADFAGYKIESGKLFLDLGYEIVDSKLLGKNSIIVSNIELGDEIEDENSSSLPLGFAIALLEDSEGIIDINMPVEGDIDAPDFKYGALVWKTFGNLIVGAVTSPFKFLGSAMGIDGDELEYVEFEPGDSIILPSEREKLDNVAKLMLKRPKISLNITGIYDKTQDSWLLKKQKFIELVLQKSNIKNKKEYQNAMNIDLLKDIYKELAPDKDPQKIEKSLEKTYKDEVLERAYLNALVKEVIQMQVVTKEELDVLSTQRAKNIKQYLVNAKSIESSRVTNQNKDVVDNETDRWVRTKLDVVVN